MVKRSVLVVEDEEDIRELISYTLLKRGIRFPAWPRARKPWRSPRPSRRPVLLDLMLPGVDGITVCQRLRSTPASSGVAIVMLTAKGKSPISSRV